MHEFHVLHAHVTRLDLILDTWNLVLSHLLSYMALQPHHSVREKAERMKRSDPAEKEAATREKEERDKQAHWNKKEAHFHNEEAGRVAQSGGGGAHPGYKTWGSHSQARDDSNATATATATAPATGTEGRYTPATTGVGHATVARDSRQPRGPVRSDDHRFT